MKLVHAWKNLGLAALIALASLSSSQARRQAPQVSKQLTVQVVPGSLSCRTHMVEKEVGNTRPNQIQKYAGNSPRLDFESRVRQGAKELGIFPVEPKLYTLVLSDKSREKEKIQASILVDPESHCIRIERNEWLKYDELDREAGALHAALAAVNRRQLPVNEIKQQIQKNRQAVIPPNNGQNQNAYNENSGDLSLTALARAWTCVAGGTEIYIQLTQHQANLDTAIAITGWDQNSYECIVKPDQKELPFPNLGLTIRLSKNGESLYIREQRLGGQGNYWYWVCN